MEGLNKEFPKDNINSFYLIETKIKLFDELLTLNDETKKMIYLIDFPGFGTEKEKNYFEKELYENILSICNSFFFIIRNLKINENDNAIKINKFLRQAKKKKGIFSLDFFLKSCVFIVNNDSNQSTNEEDLNVGKEQIMNIIPNIINKENINLSFFNAEFYKNYYNYLNYFSDLDDLFKLEYKNYQIYCNHIFKNPELYINDKICKTYISFLKTVLNEKIKKR